MRRHAAECGSIAATKSNVSGGGASRIVLTYVFPYPPMPTSASESGCRDVKNTPSWCDARRAYRARSPLGTRGARTARPRVDVVLRVLPVDLLRRVQPVDVLLDVR